MKNIYKLAESLNKKYKLVKSAEASDVQQIVNIMNQYESKSEFLTVFISALDAYAETTAKELDPVENAQDIEEIQKQVQLIESGINSIINQVAEIDAAWAARQEAWLADFKGTK